MTPRRTAVAVQRARMRLPTTLTSPNNRRRSAEVSSNSRASGPKAAVGRGRGHSVSRAPGQGQGRGRGRGRHRGKGQAVVCVGRVQAPQYTRCVRPASSRTQGDCPEGCHGPTGWYSLCSLSGNRTGGLDTGRAHGPLYPPGPAGAGAQARGCKCPEQPRLLQEFGQTNYITGLHLLIEADARGLVEEGQSNANDGLEPLLTVAQAKVCLPHSARARSSHGCSRLNRHRRGRGRSRMSTATATARVISPSHLSAPPTAATHRHSRSHNRRCNSGTCRKAIDRPFPLLFRNVLSFQARAVQKLCIQPKILETRLERNEQTCAEWRNAKIMVERQLFGPAIKAFRRGLIAMNPGVGRFQPLGSCSVLTVVSSMLARVVFACVKPQPPPPPPPSLSAQISATTKRGCRPWAGSPWGPGNRGADLLLPPPPPNRNGAGPKAGPAPPPPPSMPSHPHCRPSHGDRGPSGSGR